MRIVGHLMDLVRRSIVNARLEIDFLETSLRFLESPNSLRRVLEIGCGTTAVPARAFAGWGHLAVGIDRFTDKPGKDDVSGGRGSPDGLFRAAQQWVFDSYLEWLSAKRLSARIKPLACGSQMDVSRLGFSSESFDLVLSKATFEHLPRVDLACEEIHRVLKAGGLGVIEAHLFTSLSGGHEYDFYSCRRPEFIEMPWRHLRDPQWEAPVFLNRLRWNEYESLLRRRFKLLSVVTRYPEGTNLLTSSLRGELSGYSEKELTTRSVVFFIQRV